MNDNNIIWYISKNNYLEGKEAESFLKLEMKHYTLLTSKIIKILNTICNQHIISSNGNIVNDVLDTADSLSIIQIQLEMLIDDIHRILE